MKSKLYQNSTINFDLWQKLIDRSEFATPFQTPLFFNFLINSSTLKPFVFAVGNNEVYDAICLVTLQKEEGLKGYFSRRAIIYGGLVLTNEISETKITLLLNNITEFLRRKAIYLEIRNLFDYSSYKETFIKAGWDYEPYQNFQLSLQNVTKENILSLFKYNRRREIKQSISHGATYRMCEDENEIYEIYEILRELYYSRVKLPLPAFDFFFGLFRNQIIKVFIVQHKGKTIGGSFCPILMGKGIYTFYYCGKREYHKNIYPTHLAILAAIEYALDNNIPMMDFMGAGKSEDKYGVKDYKSQFGGELVEHGRFIKILNPLLFNLGKIGLKVLSMVK